MGRRIKVVLALLGYFHWLEAVLIYPGEVCP